MSIAFVICGLLALTALALRPLFLPPLPSHAPDCFFPDQHKYWLPAHENPRRGLFAAGTRYRVLQDLVQGRTRFAAGEVLTFLRADYCRSDHAYVYCFAHTDGSADDWWLPDCDPTVKSQLYFEPLC